jgi:hypothetical protein
MKEGGKGEKDRERPFFPFVLYFILNSTRQQKRDVQVMDQTLFFWM